MHRCTDNVASASHARHHINNLLLDADLAQVMRAVNEMLLQAPNDGTFVELFPFFPANESVCNEPAD